MIIRFRFLRLVPMWTSFFCCLIMALLLQSCAKRCALTPLPAGASLGTNLGTLTCGADEVWILARGENAAAPDDQTPGSGTLLAKIEEKEVPMPLKHTDVRASVSGYIGTVEVTQQF